MNYIITQKLEEKKRKRQRRFIFYSIKATVRTFSPVDFYTVKIRIFNIVSEMESKYLFTANVNNQPHRTQSSHSENNSGYNNYPSGSSYNNKLFIIFIVYPITNFLSGHISTPIFCFPQNTLG